MKILKFTLSGKHAMFKKPEVNSIAYFTYGQIHKPVLLGIFGAILGYKGYSQMDKINDFPEYYEKLQNLKVSIVPNSDNGFFSKKITFYNNSVGYASFEQGGNLIVKEQWIEEPSWDIYVLLDCLEANALADAVMERKCVFIPYLGKNAHIADITSMLIYDGEKVEKAVSIDSLCLKDCVEIDTDSALFSDKRVFKYEEALPVKLTKETNQYMLSKFVFTNMDMISVDGEVWKADNKNLMFF